LCACACVRACVYVLCACEYMCGCVCAFASSMFVCMCVRVRRRVSFCVQAYAYFLVLTYVYLTTLTLGGNAILEDLLPILTQSLTGCSCSGCCCHVEVPLLQFIGSKTCKETQALSNQRVRPAASSCFTLLSPVFRSTFCLLIANALVYVCKHKLG
jgi:hypothetical protein